MLLSMFTITISQFAAIVASVYSEDDSESDRRRKRKLEHEALPFMQNKARVFGAPQLPLESRDRFGRMVEDPNRNYCKKLTHMYSWEIQDLADLLKEEICAPRQTAWRKKRRNAEQHGNVHPGGRPPKHNHVNRLLFVLEWLSKGSTGDAEEFETGWSKTSCVEDKKHVLKAINKVLADEVKWPDAEQRREHYSTYSGIFANVVGILDIWEHPYKKSKDPEIEHKTFSGKANTNTKKTIGIIDKSGYFIYYKTNLFGRPNDRDTWTSSELYMNAGKYFSEGERVAADGGFAGDGPCVISFSKVDDRDKALYNVAFKEVRVGIENAFGRIQMWFPILGINLAYWKYDDEMLELAVGAAIKLHNWMLRKRGLAYDAQENPNNFHRDMY